MIDHDTENMAQRHRFGDQPAPLPEQPASRYGWPWIIYLLVVAAVLWWLS
jgi:hypothetical protein